MKYALNDAENIIYPFHIMFFNSQYFPLIVVTAINFIVLYMLYRDLNAVKASISQLSAPQKFLSPTFELIPPGTNDTEIIPSSPIEVEKVGEQVPEKKEKVKSKE